MLRRTMFFLLALSLVAFIACGGDDAETSTTEDTAGGGDTSTADTTEDASAEPDAGDKDVCEPACEGKVCGDDGCGGTCADCDPGHVCSDDQSACECVPNCDGKTCGDDGCDGSCGECDEGSCVAGACCVPDCTDLECGGDGCGGSCGECADGICQAGTCGEVGFGLGSRMSAMYIPELPEATGDESGIDALAGAVCLEVGGEEGPDNGLGALLETLADFGVNANEEIAGMMEEGAFNIILDFPTDTTATDYGPFDLTGYLGEIDEGTGEYMVDPASFTDSGAPMIGFDGAVIGADGVLTAGPADFFFSIPISGLTLDLTISQAQAVSTITEVAADGVAHAGGTIGGAIFKADLASALDAAAEYCETAEEPPQECSYLSMVDMSIIETLVTFDQEFPGCGKEIEGEVDCTAISACVFIAGEKAVIGGLLAE
jgi:hypothetical protein